MAYLAARLGVSRTLFNYKVNVDNFTPEQMAIISEVYGLPMCEVFPDTGQPEAAIEEVTV